MEETKNLVGAVEIFNPAGESMDPVNNGERTTWPNQWVELSATTSGKYTLKVTVNELKATEVVTFIKNFPESYGAPEEIWAFPKWSAGDEGGKVYETTFNLDLERNQTDTALNNLCVVEIRDSGHFTTHEFSVQFHKDRLYLVYQETYHGPVVQKNFVFCIPDLERRHITNPKLRQRLFDYFFSKKIISKLPKYNPHYRCWAERMKFGKLKGRREDGKAQIVVIAMATPIGLMFGRDRRGTHVMFPVKNVVVFEGCPVPTVGSICWASLKEQPNGLFAEQVEMLPDAESEQLYTSMQGAKKRFIPDFHPNVEFQPDWKPEHDNTGVERSGVNVRKAHHLVVPIKGTNLKMDVHAENTALLKARPEKDGQALELKFD